MLEDKVTKDIDKVLGLNDVIRLGASSSELAIPVCCPTISSLLKKVVITEFF
jgi:hypothetical protein